MFHWIPFDYDNTFGVDWFGANWSTIDPYDYANIDGTPRPLTEYIFQNEKYVNLFSHFLEFYATQLINNANLDQRLDSIKTMIYNSVRRILITHMIMDLVSKILKIAFRIVFPINM